MKTLNRVTPLLTIVIMLLFFPAAGHSAAPMQFTKTESAALLEFARGCLLARLDGSAMPSPPQCATRRQRACFVTFFSGKRVFACFGGFSPRRASLGEEIDENVRLALKNDARSRGVSRETARSAGVQITFPLGQPQRVDDYRSIDPLREGMFVENGDSGVAFVPGEARTASWAFREALRRLNVADPAGVRVYRFRAEEISTRSSGSGL
ncbi:MAG: AMMECR1 domain-containing protein [Desulfuromonadales bacterium]|nr:AMMECR1 domain-containing protein [Desulfuromonadales bacterium]